MKIVSLIPNLTELIVALGLADQLVGRTRFCIHPQPEIHDIPIIGGTKNPRINDILELQPDIIIANKEENRKEDVEALAEEVEVMVTDIETVDDALIAIHEISHRLNAAEAGESLITQIQEQLPEHSYPEITTAYFIWKDPWMTVGRVTYIHDVMKRFGLKNVYGDQKRYPETDIDTLKNKYPDLTLLSSEPYPFKEKHIQELQEKIPGSRVMLVDGEWFSWYGSRMLPAFRELRKWRELVGR